MKVCVCAYMPYLSLDLFQHCYRLLFVADFSPRVSCHASLYPPDVLIWHAQPPHLGKE